MIAKLKPGYLVLSALMVLTLILLLPRQGAAQTTGETAAQPEVTPLETLQVAEIVLAKSYDSVIKAPVDTASTFTVDVGKVICYTRITGAEDSREIIHVWYHEGKTMAKVKLPIGSPNWRTYSSKNLLPSWTGKWEVKVLDESDTVLATVGFTIQ